MVISAPLLLLFPPISYYYNVLFLFPSFILWLKSQPINKKFLWAESLLFAVVFNSLSWFFFSDLGHSSNSFFVPSSIILLFLISIYYYRTKDCV
jgi:hypothetical protein